ncbi:MAG: hypothetical protein BWY31_03631 [Lentisphaerae bacterium ADurb.Bin242]|nr:MAG: hypothetical protein BWY31_03631 [Lentisphaerae bacterium ADurb.Bin242]
MKHALTALLSLFVLITTGQETAKNFFVNPDFIPAQTPSGKYYFPGWTIPYHGGMKKIEPDKGWHGKYSVKIISDDTPGPETQMMVLQRFKKDQYKPGKYLFSVNAQLDRKVRRLSLLVGQMDKTGKRTYQERSYYENEQAEPGQWRTYVFPVELPPDEDNSKNIGVDFRVWNAKAAVVWFDSPKLVKIEDE